MTETYQKRLQNWAGGIIQSFSNHNSRSNHSVLDNRKVPACDIYENDSHFIALLDVPGYDEKNINVEVKVNEIQLTGKAEAESTKCHISDHILNKLNCNSKSSKKESVIDSDYDQSRWTKHLCEREATFQAGWHRTLYFPPESLADISNAKVYDQSGILIVVVPKLPMLSSTKEIVVEANLNSFLNQGSKKDDIDVPDFDAENFRRRNLKHGHTVNVFNKDEVDDMNIDPAVADSLPTD